jgi:hypothetical protein
LPPAVPPAAAGARADDGLPWYPGAVQNTSVGRDMIAEIRHIEGMVAVRDRLIYPPDEGPQF